jgi:L-alanine-DL-glutamate epimerase-like enolase superfamily enzyme
MKITAVRPHLYSAPLEDALWTAQEALKDSAILLVEIETDAGITGYG